MSAAAVQGTYRARIRVPRKYNNPENSQRTSHSRGYSVNLHCIKDGVLLDPAYVSDNVS